MTGRELAAETTEKSCGSLPDNLVRHNDFGRFFWANVGKSASNKKLYVDKV